MISVLTYNIRYGRKLGDIMSWVKKLSGSYDIINFQEFPSTRITYVLNALKPLSYEYRYASAITRNKEKFGEITLVNSKKIKILDTKVITLKANYLEKKIIRNGGERSSLITKLLYGKKTFIMANTHLICLALNSHRRSQILQVMEHMNSLSGKEKLPAVMLGDFNYSSMIRQKKLIELMQSQDFINGYKANTHKLLFLKDHQLDYVFYRQCVLSNVEIEKLNLSDHYPVRFTMSL